MQCVKTGAQIYLTEFGEYAIADAFQLDLDGGPGNLVTVYAFEIVTNSRDNTPPRDKLHYTIHSVDHWFGENTRPVSTLVATSVTDHGYEGKPL